MENKVLIKLIIPELDDSYDLFIPVSESIFSIKKLIIKLFGDILNNGMVNNNFVLMNKYTSRVYKNNEFVIDTDIRNATELLLIACN
ncbi:MAG: hypothetical protein VZS44_08495 [Bacilli bacterium]|nr:hypothetical protein [Bacilli bacterium]